MNYLKIEKRDWKYTIENLYFDDEENGVSHNDVSIHIETQTKEIFKDVYGMEFDIEKMGENGLDKLLICATHLKVILEDE